MYPICEMRRESFLSHCGNGYVCKEPNVTILFLECFDNAQIFIGWYKIELLYAVGPSVKFTELSIKNHCRDSLCEKSLTGRAMFLDVSIIYRVSKKMRRV